VPRPRLLVDAGPLIALVNRRDRFHKTVVQFFGSYFGELLTTWPVLTEATHQIPEHLVLSFLKLLRGGRIRIFELGGALPRIEELMRRYADHPASNVLGLRLSSHPVIAAVPRDESGDAVLQTGAGREAHVRLQVGHVRIGGRHVARLHRQ